jgi:ATP-dependent protease ClpP protease subunit
LKNKQRNDEQEEKNQLFSSVGDVFVAEHKTFYQLFYVGNINVYTIKVIIQEINKHPKKPFYLMLNSGGGDATLIKMFYNVLKPLGMKGIIGFGSVASSAFQIMLYCKEKGLDVRIDPFCHVIVHRVMSIEIPEERAERIDYYLKTWVNSFEKIFDELNYNMFKKFTVEQNKIYKDGYNVYLLGKNLIEIGVFEEYGEEKLLTKGAKNG